MQAATHYTLSVVDGAGVPQYELRYTSDEAQCTATCMVTPDQIALADGPYSFTVTTENAAGKGVPSAAVAFNVKASVIEPPVLIAPTGDVAQTKPTYQWRGVLGSATYTLLVLDAQNVPVVNNAPFIPTDVCDPATQVCSAIPDVELRQGAHTFTVTAADAGGNVATSTPLPFNVVVPLTPPVGISPTGNVGVPNPPFHW